MAGAARSFRIGRVAVVDAARAHEFHRAHLTEFLWPRDAAAFEQLCADESLYQALDAQTGEIAAICYVREENEVPEFGGVFVREDCRGCALGFVLGAIALAADLVMNPSHCAVALIAHVHSENEKPRKMLDRLGFIRTGQEQVPRAMIPATMRRDASGNVTGDVFTFAPTACARLADVIEGLTPNFVLTSKLFEGELRADSLAALRDIAAKAVAPQ